ncbi:MAG: tRNA (adenosine(37)-N6)-threonylcarbamoyltransferase complex dimerization subunit type 1 TsaB [Terriglobales bacterium]
MLLLAADTSGKHGSIALAQCGPESACTIIEVVALDGGTFSAQFVPQVAALLAKHSFGKQNIDAFAVVSGPGSFTGLRIGLAAIKGLAEILAKPIAAVSLLEVLALAGSAQGKVMTVLDAGRGEVYAGTYQITGRQAQLLKEQLLSRSELIEAATNLVVVTADPGLAELASDAGLRVETVDLPRSDAIARLGWQKILAGETVSPAELEANYIRRSADIFSKSNS